MCKSNFGGKLKHTLDLSKYVLKICIWNFKSFKQQEDINVIIIFFILEHSFMQNILLYKAYQMNFWNKIEICRFIAFIY